LVCGSEQIPCESGTYCPSGTDKALDCPSGATCVVPASPELALGRDQFDLTESEIIETEEYKFDVNNSVAILAYELSLSAQPQKDVNVTISSEIKTALCYGHGSKFVLEKQQFVFTKQTYNISQTVKITVNRLNKLEYEGAFSALFQHSIRTDDNDFKSAFLRPVVPLFRPTTPRHCSDSLTDKCSLAMLHFSTNQIPSSLIS
jgi:hypothetical protein